MQVYIKRNDQEFGPYPAAALRLYLEKGSILPQDLARLDSDPATAWRPLARLMRQQGIDSPVISGAFRPAGVLGDLRSLDLRLIFPYHDIRSGRWLKDRKVLLFVGIGMLPVLLVCVGPSIGVIYWCLSLYFAAVWAMFFYQMFRTPEVRPGTAALCFFATGGLAIPAVLAVQQVPPLSLLYAMAMSGSLPARLLGMTLGVGLTEELAKAAVVYYVASRPGRVLLPQTVVLYGMISGLGFGSVEGVAYQQGANRMATADMNYFLNVLRLTSLPFLHSVWAGISAYFLSFSMIVPRKRVGLRVVAIAVPALFHGLYDTFGAGFLGLGVATLSAFFLVSYLASCRQMKDHLTGSPTPP